jgi:hypothetical protein
MPDEQRNQLRVMMMKELVEFLWPANQLRNNSDAEAQGRSSGEVSSGRQCRLNLIVIFQTEWKLARGELASENFIGTMIKPSQSEILKGSLMLFIIFL